MYIVTYVNPSHVFRTEPQKLVTRSKVEVRNLLKRARQYPGSCEILTIAKTTKAHGTEYFGPRDF